ncbi:MAG: TIGR03086 family protein [Kutzneria sp.]|nr:TIGR03086 family protein [Kutzneria sp.]MBV9845880.1 TIGR03086 family protein [Kutzneria sp.]
MSETADRYRRTAADLLARIEATPAERWSAPSPCPGWTARDVVAHTINEQRRGLAAVRGEQPRPLHGVGVADMGTLPEVADDADLAAAWREVSAAMAAAIDDPACADVPLPTPVGPQPFSAVAELLPEDPLVHTWDLARAVGGDERLDEEVVAHCYELFKAWDTEGQLRQPWAFGAEIEPPAGADLQTEFLCFLGRRP